jgi:hypothetical protein
MIWLKFNKQRSVYVKTGLILILVFVAASSVAICQESWQDELKKDMVTIKDDKFVIESFSLDRIALPGYEPVEFQVGCYSEAPANGVISRDNFVAFSSILAVTILQVSFAEAYDVSASEFLAAYESRDISKPIGRPDIEIKVYMTEEGFQIEFANTATEEKIRSTQTWDSLFETDN